MRRTTWGCRIFLKFRTIRIVFCAHKQLLSPYQCRIIRALILTFPINTFAMMWTFALAFCCFHIKAVFSLTNPEEYVNTLGGSDSRVDLSRGNTLPLVGRPWGFNSWAPMTDTDPTYSSWWFHPNDRRYYGLRCTHQPSPWIDDYGQFRLVASISSPQHGGVGQYSGYKPSSSTWKPYYFNATLLAYGTEQSFTTVEFTPSTHGGILHAHFPKYEADTNFIQTRRIAIVLNGGLDASEVIEAGDNNPPGIRGKVVKNAGGAGTNFGHYFVAYVYSGENGVEIVKPIATSHDSEMAYLEFDPKNPATEHITVRIATSLISYEQASFNLQDEVGADQAFSDIFEDAKQEWNDVLTRVNIKSLNDEYSMVEKIKLYEVFYSNLYRASLFPRQLSEKSLDTGELIHWSPYDPEGAVYDGALTSDSGFWDAYIVVYPYLSLVNRESLGTMIQGWVNAYSEGGWLPKWASPGYRGSMVGTMGDVTLSDAIVKKIPGFDVEKAYEAVRKDAFVEPPSDRDGVGRVCLPAYVKYGYIPRGSLATDGGACDEVVSRTLNYMVCILALYGFE